MPEIRLAGCAIRDDQGRLLLLHRNTPQRRHWEMPGGKIEPGEDAETAAIRELREEIGVEVTIQSLLGTKNFTEDGRTMAITWFLATITQCHLA